MNVHHPMLSISNVKSAFITTATCTDETYLYYWKNCLGKTLKFLVLHVLHQG